jgi:hypothetical protein
VKKLLVALAAAVGLLAGLLVPASTADAIVTAKADKDCLDELATEKKPYVGKPFRVGRKTIHFGIAEWHNPPSCDGHLRRTWVKVYKVKNGPDRKVFSTRKQTTYTKTFAKGTYRVKVRFESRYWNADKRAYSKWLKQNRNKTIRIS